MYTKYITYNFSMTIGPHVYDSLKITKQKKMKKNVMPIYKISYSLIYSGFFLKIGYYYAFITKQMQKNIFLNGISSKNFKFLNYFKFN